MRGRLAAAGFTAVLVAGAAHAGRAEASNFVVTTGCQEHQAFVEGDASVVRSRLPRRYTPVHTPSGRPLLFVRAIRCSGVTIGRRTAPATMANFGIVIDSPDGRGCASGSPAGGAAGDRPPICNWYPLFWLADDRRVVEWLRRGTPGFPAVHVRGLEFRLGAFDPARGGAPFFFRAPAPSPSRFTIDELARERPGELSVRGGYWVDTPQGTVKLAFSTDTLSSGDATGVVRAARGSAMAKLLGARARPYVLGYSSFAAERWTRASYRKQLLSRPHRGHSFAGSCSLRGTNAFDPPATNVQASLTYDYQATGTCTGRLDGRPVSDAPVRLRNAGAADASCLRGVTTAPGHGTLAFTTGETIRYTLEFRAVLTEIDATLYGDGWGTARGHGTFLTPRTPPDVAARCAGAGLAEAPMDMTIDTETPLKSAAGQLRLAVSPRGARAGRRSRFGFLVTTRDGRAVPGALVRFAGRRVRTGAEGRAALEIALRRPGRHVASASKRGFRAARATVRAGGTLRFAG